MSESFRERYNALLSDYQAKNGKPADSRTQALLKSRAMNKTLQSKDLSDQDVKMQAGQNVLHQLRVCPLAY